MDSSFKGNKSSELSRVIDKGIASKDKHEFALVGSTSDDKGVFIDSYKDKKMEMSDLKKLGNESLALQGSSIGHYLNEIQEPGGFNAAHNTSLGVEGKIYGELVGDNTINTRIDIPAGAAVNGYQTFTRQYNSNNRFEMQQGAVSKTTITNMFNGVKVPFPVSNVISTPTGELKSVKKLP